MPIIKKKIRKTVDVVIDILCDCCGKSCKIKTIGDRTEYSYMELNASWGFGSKKDLEKWSAKVCEKCVDKKLSTMIKFQIMDFHINSYVSE